MQQRRIAVAVLPLLLLLVTSCAVQRSKAPQINAKTAYALNLEAQVDQANKDYITFFKDVGVAYQSGQLTESDVAGLNTIGHHVKPLIEEANHLAKVYATNYDSSVANQVGQLLIQIANDFSRLYIQRAQAIASKAVPK